MKEVYKSLIYSVAFLLLGFLMIYLGYLRGTYMSEVIFAYIAAIFFIMSFILFVTFIQSIFHKDYPVKKPPKDVPDKLDKWDRL